MASEVRGTVLLGSLRALRARGLYEPYLQVLPTIHHGAIAALTAASWQPIDLAMAHYKACDALGLDRATTEAIGRESGLFVNATLLNVVSRVSRSAGVTPWFALENAHKLRARTWVGSSICVYKLGPKEARFEWIQLPVAQFSYMRVAFGAFAAAIGGLFTNLMVVKDTQPDSRTNKVSYKMSWV
jgi:hypothetical protein